MSYARRRANLGRYRLIPNFAAAVTGLFTATPNQHHNQDQNQDATTDNDGDVHGPDLSPAHTRALAAGINLLVNTTYRARSSWSVRGELAAWRAAMPDLPDTFDDAVDTLTVYENHLIDQLNRDWAHLAPTIRRLNHNQPSPTCWARPAHKPVTDTWTGRDQWITHALKHLDDTMTAPGTACSTHNRLALITALAHSTDEHGHNLTASHKTIARRAITDHGCTLALSTATHRLRVIRYLLEDAGLHHIDALGGHLTADERTAAWAHHGHRQTRAGNTAHLTLPAHLRPTPPSPSPRPAYAHGLTHRLTTRGQHEKEKYTYSYTHRLSSSLGSHRVAHPRAHAREHTTIPHNEAQHGPASPPATTPLQTHTPSPTAPTSHTDNHPCPDTPTPARIVPSLRAWRIADDLTRVVDGCAAANGPYARLVGPSRGQASLLHLARLIDTHTPALASTRDVMRAIAHAATSQATGYIALGLPRHRNHLPHNPTGWLTTLFSRLDFTNPDQHPTWTHTAEAFGVTWNGTRHQWTPIG